MSKSTPPSPRKRVKSPDTAKPSANIQPSWCTPLRAGRPSASESESLTDKIIEAGWELLVADGLEAFSFDRLAKFARVGKPTIYARFKNKHDYLRALLEYQLDRKHEEAFASVQNAPFRAAFVDFAEQAVARFLSPEGRLIDQLIDLLDKDARESAIPVRQWAYAKGRDRLADQMRNACATGEISLHDIPVAVDFFLEGLIGHARISETATDLTAETHHHWAQRFCGMILREFGAKEAR